MRTVKNLLIGAGALFALAAATPALAQSSCQTSPFPVWLDQVKKEAAASGISERAISASLDGVTFDPGIVKRDHGQKVFKQSFEQFSARMVNSFRLTKGGNLLRAHGSLFQRIEQQFGVPGPVLVAIWGLETDFGSFNGSFPTIQALATLAYDCRRSAMFRKELFDAMRIVQRGDMQPANMKGAWAGEIGQTQFMPSSYIKYAIDYDGDGRRDLIRSAPDVLASTANYLKNYGWQKGAGWEPGEPNFAVIKEWNKSDVYSKTIAYFATRLAANWR